MLFRSYAYSTFCERFRAWKACVSPTMRQTHVAGEKLFVDWAGDTIGVFDPATGVEHRARIFVAALGASNFTYAEARWTETLPDWVGAHVNALAGSVAPCPSVACPVNAMGSPTFQVSEPLGVSITGWGRESSTRMSSDVVPLARPVSVTRSLTARVPAVV